tara:strand:+ start:424 stop:1188 length:765 start_codon:yes stop_codon:yes gene_type:complete
MFIAYVCTLFVGAFSTILGVAFVLPVFHGHDATALTWVFGAQSLIGIWILGYGVMQLCELLGRFEDKTREQLLQSSRCQPQVKSHPLTPVSYKDWENTWCEAWLGMHYLCEGLTGPAFAILFYLDERPSWKVCRDASKWGCSLDKVSISPELVFRAQQRHDDQLILPLNDCRSMSAGDLLWDLQAGTVWACTADGWKIIGNFGRPMEIFPYWAMRQWLCCDQWDRASFDWKNAIESADWKHQKTDGRILRRHRR